MKCGHRLIVSPLWSVQTYLEASEFRRKMDRIQRAASGNDVEGVTAGRVAGEENVQYVLQRNVDRCSFNASHLFVISRKQWGPEFKKHLINENMSGFFSYSGGPHLRNT